MNDLDNRYMRLALSLGRRGQGRVWPWPSVGCVLVKDGRIIGCGTSDTKTLRHAERVALDQAGNAKGATAYVTLEPCAHQGRTPPCANALVEAGVDRVVIAAGDPNPLVAGKGVDILRAAGIEVKIGVLEGEARADMAGFLSVQERSRPYVTVKLALSLDGRIATVSGESQWITGPQARRYVHALRARHDAVMVGAGTVRADDPELTVRGLGMDHQPVRIVISSDLNLPTDARMFRDDAAPWICHAGKGQFDGSAKLIGPCGTGPVDLSELMTKLAQQGLTSILCEGGGQLTASLIKAGLVDELQVLSAGLIIGSEGLSGIAGIGLQKLDDGPRPRLVETRQIGPDLLNRWLF